MNTKFKLDKRDYKIEDDGTVVYRIQALEGFHSQIGYIPAGAYGGYVEKETNLSKHRTCWIDENSVVKGDALVASEAMVINSVIDGNATLGDKSWVANSYVSDYAVVSGRSAVLGSMVTHNAVVSGGSRIFKTHVCGDACLFDTKCIEEAVIDDCVGSFIKQEKESEEQFTFKYTLIPLGGRYKGLFRLRANEDIDLYCASTMEYKFIPRGSIGGIVSGVHNLSRFGSCWIDYDSMVTGDASVHDYAFVTGKSFLCGNVVVCGGALVDHSVLRGNAYVAGKALVKDMIVGGKPRVFGAAWCEGDNLNTTKDNSNNVKESDFEVNAQEEKQAEKLEIAQQFR